MAKYDEKFKKSVIQDYFDSGGGYQWLAAKYSVRHGQIKHWMGFCRQNGARGWPRSSVHLIGSVRSFYLQKI
jgi:transposase